MLPSVKVIILGERLSEYVRSPLNGLIECAAILTLLIWSKILKKDMFNEGRKIESGNKKL